MPNGCGKKDSACLQRNARTTVLESASLKTASFNRLWMKGFSCLLKFSVLNFICQTKEYKTITHMQREYSYCLVRNRYFQFIALLLSFPSHLIHSLDRATHKCESQRHLPLTTLAASSRTFHEYSVTFEPKSLVCARLRKFQISRGHDIVHTEVLVITPVGASCLSRFFDNGLTKATALVFLL